MTTQGELKFWGLPIILHSTILQNNKTLKFMGTKIMSIKLNQHDKWEASFILMAEAS
jgi:hypothetical protein